MLKHLVLLVLLMANFTFAFKENKRRFQLDSLMSDCPLKVRVDMDFLLEYVNKHSRNEEEKVYLCCSFLAVYFKYDHKRLRSLKKSSLHPKVIFNRKKGICGDYSTLFAYLLKKLNVPCVEVCGKVNILIIACVISPFKLLSKLKRLNHAWNLVKIDGQWFAYDPTWINIASSSTVYIRKSNKQRRRKVLIHHLSLDYMHKRYTIFYDARSAIHPAFYMNNEEVVLYSKKHKKKIKNKWLTADSSFRNINVLDSLQLPYFKYSIGWRDEVKNYFSKDIFYYYLEKEVFSFLSPENIKEAGYNLSDVRGQVSYLKGLIERLKKQGISQGLEVKIYAHLLSLVEFERKLKCK